MSEGSAGPAPGPIERFKRGAAHRTSTMAKVEVVSTENGPNLVMIDGKVEMAMCRCGHSKRKPLCDGSHRAAGFVAPKATTKVLE